MAQWRCRLIDSWLFCIYNNLVNAQYDDEKNWRNIAKHGISLEAAQALDWSRALTSQDRRHDYGELRYVTIAPIEDRLHVLVWTKRDCMVRPISLRKANKREADYYEQDN